MVPFFMLKDIYLSPQGTNLTFYFAEFWLNLDKSKH